MDSHFISPCKFVYTYGIFIASRKSYETCSKLGRKIVIFYNLRNEYNSLWCWMLYRVVLAERYKDCVLFFPHNMDFRGRVYPISPYLSHMGDDVSRSLLKFAKGKLFCEEYHYEKISLSSRIENIY